MPPTKNILFVCTENVGCRQMAEVFLKKFSKSNFDVISAGNIPSETLNPTVVMVMKEIGIDIINKNLNCYLIL